LQIDVEIKDKKVQRLFTRLQRNVKDLRPAFRAIGEIVRSSVIKNFQEGGRPEKWEPARIRSIYQAYTAKKTKSGGNRKAYTIRGRLTKAFDRYSSGKKTLIDGAYLMNSITARAETDRVIVGTKKCYARIHQFGGMAGRNKKVKIPARPYLLVQEEDWKTIRDCLRGFLMKGVEG
jgi:phage virion morphogenesis protein